jgi:D-arginine dehydrogenase
MSQTLPGSATVVIVGGGLAGAATACFLARRGTSDVILLEAEDQFGVHASGRNASMVRQVASDPVTGALLHRSAALIAAEDRLQAGESLLRASGSLLLVDGREGDAWVSAAVQARDAGLDTRVISREDAIGMVPMLTGAGFDQAIHTLSDGILDVHGLLWRYLAEARAAGVMLATACPVTGIDTAGGRVTAVATPRGRVACSVVVDAAGAWSNRVASLAGLDPLPMAPFRRHLIVTPPLDWVDPAWPLVWHLTDEWYFRPEVGGLLLSPCDQTPVEPGPCPRDQTGLELLAEKMSLRMPALADLPVKAWWAGLRTISADGRFVVGPDPRLEGFHWVAGLGGHGMTASAAVGDLAAAGVLGGSAPDELAAAVRPDRFLAGRY